MEAPFIDYRVGDVRERLADIPDNSIDLIVTSPPFLALRSYLPDDHPGKHLEIGSEPDPASFIDTMLGLSAEWGRVLAPHGSLCVELGDTYSGNNLSGFHRGAPEHTSTPGRTRAHTANSPTRDLTDGWPLSKSMTLIPTLYTASLNYGRNLLTGRESPAGMWRIRNVIVWARPNPPVGALGDKFRPATSYITVACKSDKRYFDLDAVRTEVLHPGQSRTRSPSGRSVDRDDRKCATGDENPAGAPPLDWHQDPPYTDGDWLWRLTTQPYKGSHYATFPLTLPTRLIEAMCPLRVCQTCGQPSTRITTPTDEYEAAKPPPDDPWRSGRAPRDVGQATIKRHAITATYDTVGWSDCGHDDWRTGLVLDPFAGSGTTLEAAQNVGRSAIGIDLDERNADLARERVGMFMSVTV